MNMSSAATRCLSLCAALAVLVIGSASLTAQPKATLTSSDINAAISWGARGDVAPYLLPYKGQEQQTDPVIVGVLYTPFVRIATAAQAAFARRQEFTAADVTAALIDPVAYVGLRWYCCDGDHGDNSWTYHPLTPFDYRLGEAGKDRFSEAFLRMSDLKLLHPLWTKRGASVLASFGAEPPYNDIVLVAAYPMAALAPDVDFVIYRELGEDVGSSRHMRVAHIGVADFARWR